MCNDQLFAEAVTKIQETERQKVHEAMRHLCKYAEPGYKSVIICRHAHNTEASHCKKTACPALKAQND